MGGEVYLAGGYVAWVTRYAVGREGLWGTCLHFPGECELLIVAPSAGGPVIGPLMAEIKVNEVICFRSGTLLNIPRAFFWLVIEYSFVDGVQDFLHDFTLTLVCHLMGEVMESHREKSTVLCYT